MKTLQGFKLALTAFIFAGCVLTGTAAAASVDEGDPAKASTEETGEAKETATEFVEGVHYVRLEEQFATHDPSRVEVIEAFSYGCPHCYELEPAVMRWQNMAHSSVDFRRLHAVWNDPMALYAQAFYAMIHMGIVDRLHVPLFNAIQIEQRRLASPRAFAEFVAEKGYDRDEFIRHFRSSETQQAVEMSEQRVQLYGISGVPQFIVNGKYRVDPARAEGRTAMLDVVNYLVEKERKAMIAD